MNIALIIGRLGSRRIKKKNIKLFFGKPVIAYPIINAIRSKIFSRVIVSTESKKISKIAKFYGAEIPFKRPKKIADNKTSTIKVIKHAIKKLGLSKKKNINICCIYPVTPLLNKKIFIKGYKKFVNSKADFLIPVLKTKHTHTRFFCKNKKGYLRETKNKKMQTYQDAGQFYWGKNKSFQTFNSVFDGKSIPLPISKNNAIDVNTHHDWKKMVNLYNSRK